MPWFVSYKRYEELQERYEDLRDDYRKLRESMDSFIDKALEKPAQEKDEEGNHSLPNRPMIRDIRAEAEKAARDAHRAKGPKTA